MTFRFVSIRRAHAIVVIACTLSCSAVRATQEELPMYELLGQPLGKEEIIRVGPALGIVDACKTDVECNVDIKDIEAAFVCREQACSAVYTSFSKLTHRYFLALDGGGKKPVPSGLLFEIEGGFKDIRQVQKVDSADDSGIYSVEYVFDGKRSLFLRGQSATLLDVRSPDNFAEIQDLLNRMLLFITPDEFQSKMSKELNLAQSLRRQPARLWQFEDNIGGNQCVVLDLSGILFLWLDRQVGFAPRRIVRLQEPTQSSRGTVLYLLQYDDYVKLENGLHIPRQIRRFQFGFQGVEGDKFGKLQAETEYSVKSFLVNDQVSESLFAHSLPPNTVVNDTDRQLLYFTAGDEIDIETMVRKAVEAVKHHRHYSLSTVFVWFFLTVSTTICITVGLKSCIKGAYKRMIGGSHR